MSVFEFIAYVSIGVNIFTMLHLGFLLIADANEKKKKRKTEEQYLKLEIFKMRMDVEELKKKAGEENE